MHIESSFGFEKRPFTHHRNSATHSQLVQPTLQVADLSSEAQLFLSFSAWACAHLPVAAVLVRVAIVDEIPQAALLPARVIQNTQHGFLRGSGGKHLLSKLLPVRLFARSREGDFM